MVTIMTDNEYALKIYCRAFSAVSDSEDANIPGILEEVKSLDVREQLALESYFRNGNTYKQTAIILGGVSTETARRIVQKAMLKLRHPYRLRKMSIKALKDAR